MSKVNYYLKGIPNNKHLDELKQQDKKTYNEILSTPHPVTSSIALNGQRFLIATGRFIQPKFWDRKNCTVKNLSDTPTSVIEDGQWFSEKKLELEKYIERARREDLPLTQNIFHQILRGNTYHPNLDKVYLCSSPTDESNLLKEFSRNYKSKQGIRIQNNTIKKYKSVLLHIEKHQGNSLFVPNQFTNKWIEEFIDYLSEEAGCNDNTICKYIKALKVFLKYQRKSGVNIPANLDEIIVSEKEQIPVALSKEELNILYNTDMESNYLNRIKDVFLFQCYTGARYSDIHKIARVDLQSNGGQIYWEFLVTKTCEYLATPISKPAQIILDKYESLSTPLPRFANQVINRELKIIGKKAKLNRMVKQIAFYNGKINETDMPLHKLISTHMARKTFITLSLENNIPERNIRMISGHKDERSFKRYVDMKKTHLKGVADVWDKIVGGFTSPTLA